MMPFKDARHPIEVIAQFAPDGKITPLRFRWRNSLFVIESTGRRWKLEDGYHILVLAAGERVFELLFAAQENRWYLASAGTKAYAI